MEFENIQKISIQELTKQAAIKKNGSGMKVRPGRQGRPIKPPLDFSTLLDADQVEETGFDNPFVISCAVCGSTKDVGFFKSGNICLKCVRSIKRKCH